MEFKQADAAWSVQGRVIVWCGTSLLESFFWGFHARAWEYSSFYRLYEANLREAF
jgi:hypothetical protein